MKYRLVQLLASESLATNATKTMDINLVTPISRIVIRMKGTNTTSTPTGHPAKMISKIELVDGSDVLYSASGIEAGCVNFHENAELPFYCCEYELPIQVCATAQLNFGRKLWDPDYALDPKRFTNLQLKITNAVASGGSTAGTCTLAIFAYVFEDSPPSPRGFLMTKELYSYGLSAGNHEYIDLPQDYPFRFVILQSYDTTYAPNDQFGNLKFTIDTDRRVLINDISMTEFIKVQIPMDLVEENWGGFAESDTKSYYQACTYQGVAVGIGRSATDAAIFVGQPAGSRVQVTGGASISHAIHQEGYVPFGGINLLMMDKMDPTTWLDPAGSKTIQLDITAGGGAAGTGYVITQQARRY